MFHCCSGDSLGTSVVSSYGLNVCVPQNLYVEIPAPRAMVLGGGPLAHSAPWPPGQVEIGVEENIQG